MGVKYCLKVLKIEHLRRPGLAFVKIVNKKRKSEEGGCGFYIRMEGGDDC